MHPVDAFSALGHFSARTRELRQLGVEPRALAAAVHRGELQRVRVGHFALPRSDPHTIAALRVGGLAACISATRLHGLWMPADAVPHVWLRRNASRLRRPPAQRGMPTEEHDHVRHWSDLHAAIDRPRGAVALLDALVQVVDCQPEHIAIAVLDSALHTGQLSQVDLGTIESWVARDRRGILRHLDHAAQSGTESIVRTVLRRAGLEVRTQAAFPGVGFVDLLVGDRVVVEVDSEQWHTKPEHRRRDYARDLELTAQGAIVVRVSYLQALYDHDGILRAVLAALATARGERSLF